MDYKLERDIILLSELLTSPLSDMSKQLGISNMTLYRWREHPEDISRANLEKLYSYAFERGVRLNKIKEQLYREDYTSNNSIVLFHGSKGDINGELSLSYSKENNDFGKGFYCGESLEQSTMFVSHYPDSSLYILTFNPAKLIHEDYSVNQDWMLTIAYFRKKLVGYEEHPIIQNLISRLSDVDYIKAPIADNRMFQIIDSFIDGEITDAQCRHCLAATNLGYQYVFISDSALKKIEILEHCYLANAEKHYYLKNRENEIKIGEDKVKIARREYRGKGLYIDEILK